MTVAAGLLNTPRDQVSWDQWAFNLDQNIRDIVAALRSQKNVALPLYPIYPIPWVAVGEWLQRVGLAMDEICANAGVQARDVENVDLEDDRAKQAWTWAVYSEIRDARANLKI